MARFFFKFYYIALDKYYGSQRQKDVLTIEDRVIKTLKERGYIHDVNASQFESASRTDRYVSARGAVFATNMLRDPILMELNAHLPNEIGIWAYCKVPNNYSPRFEAQMRHYRYIVQWPFSFLKKKYNFDFSLVNRACKKLEGVHDFQNFSKRDSSTDNTIRDMKSIETSTVDEVIIIDFKSEAFLRQQIRRIAQKLIELGKGELSYEAFAKLLDPSEFKSFQPANPKGLILWDINYDNDIVDFKIDEKSVSRMNNFLFDRKMRSFLNYNLFSLIEGKI